MKSPDLSRRSFFATAGVGAAAVWIPKPVKGYRASELEAMTVDDRLTVGVSKWELDTPALCVDLDKLEANIARMETTARRVGIASRPHAKTHKCPAIARLQVARGSVGICTAKLSEAGVFLEHGIDDVLMTTINVSPAKIRRAMTLRKWHPGFIQAVDTLENARDLSDAAREAGILADVVVDVAAGRRTGIPPGDEALELAQTVDDLPGLNLRGLLCYDGGAQHIKGFAARRDRAREMMEPAAETRHRMIKAGLNTEIFSGGGTGTYNIFHETDGVTDVQVGSYVFMDAQYLSIGSEDGNETYTDFAPSLTVITTILNAKVDGHATADAGTKSLTLNKPNAIVVGETGIHYRVGSDEFGSIRYENPSRIYMLGDKLELIVPHCDPVVNLYDRMYGTRNDLVEVIWPIAARGMAQ